MLIVSMIFIVILSTLAVSIVTMSGANVQLAQNLHKADYARATAESGFNVICYSAVLQLLLKNIDYSFSGPPIP